MKLFVKNTPVIVDPFFAKLFKLFPDRPFEVYPDSPGVWVWYPKHNDWPEYKRGERVGIALRQKKTSVKKALAFLKRWSKMPEKTNRQVYRKLVVLGGFHEGLSDSNSGHIDLVSWKVIRKALKLSLADWTEILKDKRQMAYLQK